MTHLVRPELPTTSVGSSQATTAAVDNTALFATCSQTTYKTGNTVQTNGANSQETFTKVKGDGFNTLEAMLISQATALLSIFASLARRASS